MFYMLLLIRRRHVYTYVGGGPGSSVYKSTDAGASWRKINKGLPGVEIGRIGMDISPVDNNVLYAIVEAADRQGGFISQLIWESRGLSKVEK